MSDRSDIKVKAMGVFRRGNHLLCQSVTENDGRDLVGYRIPGGHVEFGESAFDTLVREIQEELSVDITDVKHLGMVENHYVWNGKAGHEVIFVYEANLADERLYLTDTINANENGKDVLFSWIDVTDKTNRLLPVALAQLLAEK